jgi:hypothetical protein
MPLPRTTDHKTPAPEPSGAAISTMVAAITEALGRLRYGSVHLTVHDGKVVQLDVTERQRFT